MQLQILIFIIGLGILTLGAEWLVRGAASLALRLGIRPLVVGLTVVALGTSMPEFLFNVFAAFKGEDGLALGNIVGSNICNIALILGISSMMIPLVVEKATLQKEYPIMMGAMVLFYVLALDGQITSLDGFILVMGLISLLVFLVFDARRSNRPPEEIEVEVPTTQRSLLMKVALVAGGILLLSVGARLMEMSATAIAAAFGINPVIIGLTVVAIGTSLPELAASVMSIVKKEYDISLGNVLGSNMLNVLFVVGLVSLIRPLEVDSESLLSIHFPIMLGFGVVLLPIAWTGYKITRAEGGLLFAGFVGYMLYIVANA